MKAELVSLQQLRCFCATARTGSFTAAADELGVTQPAVAEHVRNLQRALGVPLVRRAGRGVTLTETGVAFAETAPRVLEALAAAVASVDDVAELRSGTLAFGLFATPEAYGIDALASRFARRYPGVALRLEGLNSSIAAERVRRGLLEAALVTLPVDDDGLEVEPIARDEVVYVSADPRRTERAVTIEMLAERPLVVFDAASGERDPLRRQLAERAQERGLRLLPRVETQTMVLALRFVADGVGDTVLPRAHTRAPYYPEGLSTAPLEPPLRERFALVTQRGARLSPAVAAFVHDVRDHMTTVIAELEDT